MDFDYDSRRPLDVQLGHRREIGSATVTDATFAGTVGREDVTLVRPERASGAGVILAHGGGDDGRHFFVDAAVELAAAGYTVALPATRMGQPTDLATLEAVISRYVLVHRRVLDLLIAQPGVDPDRLGYYGHSVGALQGAILVGVEPRLRAAVLAAYGSGSLRRFSIEDGEQDEARLAARDRYDPARFIGPPHEAAVLLQFGRHDDVVRMAEAEALARAAHPSVETRWYDWDHGLDADPAARRDRAAFLGAALR